MADQFELLTTARFYLELKLDGSQEPIDGYFMECQGFKRYRQGKLMRTSFKPCALI